MLRRSGIEPGDLGAVVLTHGHADHAGAAAAFVERDVPVVVGAADVPIVARGSNPTLLPTGPAARLLRRVLVSAFPAFTPSDPVDGTVDLAPFGLDAEYRVVGGHTDGSGVLVAEGVIAVGDLLRGGYLGGAVLGGVAHVHYFSPDPVADLATVADLIDDVRPQRILVGHGGPLDADAARRRIDVLVRRRTGSARPQRVSR